MCIRDSLYALYYYLPEQCCNWISTQLWHCPPLSIIYHISRIGQTSNQSSITQQRSLQCINPIEDVWLEDVNTGHWHSSRSLQCTTIHRAGVAFFLNICWLTIFQKFYPSKHHRVEVIISTSNWCEKCHLKYLIMERFSWWSSWNHWHTI